MESVPARWPQVARWKPAAPSPRPARSPIPRAGHAPERARRAVPALRSADPATESRSPEARVPGHRRSGPAARSETAGRAAAQKQAACLHDGRVVSAVARVRRPEEIAPAPMTMAVCARPRNVRCSSKLRHRFQVAAAAKGRPYRLRNTSGKSARCCPSSFPASLNLRQAVRASRRSTGTPPSVSIGQHHGRSAPRQTGGSVCGRRRRHASRLHTHEHRAPGWKH